MGLLIDFLRWVPEYFFPKVCVGCKKEGWWVCPACRQTVPTVIDHPICPECAKPSALGATHPGCKRRYGLDGLTSFYHYDGWAKTMMRGAKFQSPPQRKPLQDLSGEFAPLLEFRLNQVLGVRLFELVETESLGDECPEDSAELIESEDSSESERPEWPEDSAPSTVKSSGPSAVKSSGLNRLNSPRGTRHQPLIVPIPLHWWRERKRGYNQAALIGRTLASTLRLQSNPAIVKRVQYTQPQTLLAVPHLAHSASTIARSIREQAQQRKKNVRGAFFIRHDTIVPSTILLVDDVWTSGATMTECCRVLKRSGARWIWGATLFRA